MRRVPQAALMPAEEAQAAPRSRGGRAMLPRASAMPFARMRRRCLAMFMRAAPQTAADIRGGAMRRRESAYQMRQRHARESAFIRSCTFVRAPRRRKRMLPRALPRAADGVACARQAPLPHATTPQSAVDAAAIRPLMLKQHHAASAAARRMLAQARQSERRYKILRRKIRVRRHTRYDIATSRHPALRDAVSAMPPACRFLR